MSQPVISIYNSGNTNAITAWDVGELTSQTDSSILSIVAWNNRGNTSEDVSDLRDAKLIVLDANGVTYSGAVASGGWVKVNVPKVDGNSTSYTAVKDGNGKDLMGEGCTFSVDGYTLKGEKNNGVLTSNTKNACLINVKMNIPINSVADTYTFKIRITGYYT